jgi:hypothetical protein
MWSQLVWSDVAAMQNVSLVDFSLGSRATFERRPFFVCCTLTLLTDSLQRRELVLYATNGLVHCRKMATRLLRRPAAVAITAGISTSRLLLPLPTIESCASPNLTAT